MRFWLAVILGILLGATPALAAGGSDVQAGQAAFQAGKFENAIARFSNVIASGKADKKALAKIFYMRGTSYLRLKRFTPAVADFSNAIWLDELPVSLQARAYIRRGRLRLLMIQHGEALKDMNAAVRLAPVAASYTARAETLIRLGKSKRAVVDLDKALSDKGAARHHVHFIRAQAFEALGRSADAKANLQKALGYKPDYTPARQMLAALGGSMPQSARRASNVTGAPQRPYMLTTGSVRPQSMPPRRGGDAAERDWMLATRTIRTTGRLRGGAGAMRLRKASPSARSSLPLRQRLDAGGYVLQLSARKTLETAKIALHHIASVNRDLLTGKELYVEKGHSARLGEIYRVRLGYFDAKKEPSALCGKLKSRGQSCFLTRK